MSDHVEFVELKIDYEKVAENVTLKGVSRETRERLARLNFPGTEDLLSDDEAKAERAAKVFARHYLGLDR